MQPAPAARRAWPALPPRAPWPPLATAWWYWGDFVLRYRHALLLIAALGAAAALLQGSILLLLNRIIAAADASGAPDLLARLGDPALLPQLAGLLLVTLSASAWLSLQASRRVLALWRRYQLHATNALLEAVQAACARGALDGGSVAASLLPHVLRQTQRLGALTRVVATSIGPCLRFLIFCGVAIHANPRLSLVLLLAALPCGALTFFYFAPRAARSARRLESLAGDAAKELGRKLAEATARRLQPLDAAAAPTPAVARVHALTERLLWVERARFATAQLSILVLVGLLFVVGRDGELTPARWGELLLYLLVLRLAFGQLADLASAISSFGRFYPVVIRHKRLLEILRAATSPADFQQQMRRAGLHRAAAGDLDDELV